MCFRVEVDIKLGQICLLKPLICRNLISTSPLVIGCVSCKHGARCNGDASFSPQSFQTLLRPKKACQLGTPSFQKPWGSSKTLGFLQNLGVPPKPWGPSKTLGSLHVGARAPQAGRRRRARGQPLVRGRRPPGGGRSRGRPAPRARSARRQSRRNLHT